MRCDSGQVCLEQQAVYMFDVAHLTDIRAFTYLVLRCIIAKSQRRLVELCQKQCKRLLYSPPLSVHIALA